MKFAYIIPFSYSDEHRFLNLQTIISYYKPLNIDIYIIEQGSSHNTKLDELGVNIIFYKNDKMFNKSKGNNFAYSKLKLKYDILIYGDSDLILNITDMSTILINYKNGKLSGIVSPYDGKLLYLTETQVISFRNNISFDYTGDYLNVYQPFGGVFFIPTEMYSQMKGFDENFIGYGGEDDAMKWKAKHLNIKVNMLDFVAYHMWHPRNKQVNYMECAKRNRTYLIDNYYNKDKFMPFFEKMKTL